jgi:hypothetical protein
MRNGHGTFWQVDGGAADIRPMTSVDAGAEAVLALATTLYGVPDLGLAPTLGYRSSRPAVPPTLFRWKTLCNRINHLQSSIFRVAELNRISLPQREHGD